MAKILFLSECTGITGGARQFLALAEGLRLNGWEVIIACPEFGETYRTAASLALPVIDFSPAQDYDVVTAVRLARYIKAENVDLVHAHHSRAHAVGLMAVRMCRRPIPFLVTRRVSFPPARNFFSRLKYRDPRISSFIAVAESIRQTLIQGGVSPERVTTIPSGVDLEYFSPRPKNPLWAGRLGLPEAVPVIGLIAHYGTWKGHDVFLRAAGLLKGRGIKAIYLLAGRETDSDEVRMLAQSNGLSSDDLRLVGFQQDMPGLLSLLDVSVSASTSGEGLSGAVREALAMEIPVAASDVGGNRELVVDGVTGWLFPPGDAKVLADVLEDILANPSAARRTALAGREEVRHRLSTEKMVEATAELYRSLLTREGRRPAERFEYVA